MKAPLSEINNKELSLFATPLGKVVQQEYCETLLSNRKFKTDRELYIHKMNDCLSCITQSFWDIELTLKLIEFAHPKIKSFKMTRIDRGEYLKYHFENYFFRLPKLKDQAVNLLNVTYQLDYPQSNSLEGKIRKAKCIDNKLFHFLNYFDDAFAKIKPLRDMIAHRSNLSDRNIAILTTHQLVPIDKEWYNSLLREQLAHTYIMSRNQNTLKRAVIALLLVLNNDFTATLSSMSPSKTKAFGKE